MVRDDHLAEVTLAIFLLFHESCVLQLMECCNVYNDNRCVPLQRMPHKSNDHAQIIKKSHR